MSQNQLIAILSCILLVVVGGSVYLLFSGSQSASLISSDSNTVDTGADNRFNTAVLEQQAYQLLNKQLIREGALPVKPPVTIGKANPFL